MVKQHDSGAGGRVIRVEFSRPAFFLILVCLVASPIVVWRMAGRGMPDPMDPVKAPGVGTEGQRVTGPWGTVLIRQTVLEPPRTSFTYVVEPGYRTRWCFRDMDRDTLRTRLVNVGIGERDADLLVQTAVAEAQIRGYLVYPPDDLVINLHPDIRARVYALLALDPINPSYCYPHSFRCDSVDEWLQGATIPDAAMERLRKLVYRRGKRLCLSDMPLVLPLIDYPLDAINFKRALQRDMAVTMHLVVDAGVPVDMMVGYWGTGGRDDQVEPIIESFRREKGGLLDIVYLLPGFPGSRLNRFPLPTAPDQVVRDCHWASFNFMNAEPDDRYGASREAVRDTIHEHFIQVRPPVRFGDVVLLINRDNGAVIHSCVYVAADVVYTKDGPTHRTPYALKRLENVVDYYKAIAPVQVEYFRRRNTDETP
ncbi:MAG: hypothetical protein A2498_03740 [Lentisphaerae bacterium RIFOXYC12_FULL_60_16]|nr:MAG: hypothetical protein A2498_03740 [Lentisphaerae bacterium RIFOXYC12_FULL_60_16]